MSDANKPEDNNQTLSEPHLIDGEATIINDDSVDAAKSDSPSASEDSTANATQQGDAKQSRTPLVIALMALLAVPALGYWSHLELQKVSDKQLATGVQLADEIASKNSALRSQVNKLEDELARLDDEREAQNLLLERTQTRLSDAIKQVEAGRSTSEADWRLAEAQYLLRLANQRVLMEQRPEGALTLMRSADKVLAELDDVSLYKLRQTIAQDIAKLEAVPNLDVEGTYLRLAALINQTSELPTLSLEQQRQLPQLLQEITPEAVDETLKQDIQSAFGRAMSSLENLVVIQQHDRPVEPLLSPEQGHYLRQNLQLLLEQAQLALLRQQQSIYETSLTRSTELITRFFDTENSATAALNSALEQLKTLQVAPKMPSISSSLEALQQHMAELTRLGAEAQR
jgi:uroporphyrin-3 C-methyltransferase